jgi:tubulysin polyketide synthase-like protein
MTANELLRYLTVRGVVLSADGDRLNVDARDELLTDDLISTLRERKTELLEALKIDRCPVCATELAETCGKRFRHVWCPMPGNHFDSWRALGGRSLKDTDAPIVRRLDLEVA